MYIMKKWDFKFKLFLIPREELVISCPGQEEKELWVHAF
jgi:hypothetical protein